jgi:serine/threonine protein kinase
MERRDTFVGTVNYMSPEVVNDEPQGLPCDTWALGNILFRTLYGAVPFPGTNPAKVYEDIKSRRITWPPEEIIDQIMSKEAQQLIGFMI